MPMDQSTFTTAGIVIILLLAFLGNYLLEPDIRKSSTNFVFFAFAALMIFSSLKMLYTGEMRSFNFQEGEIKILLDTHPFQFLGSLIFKLSLGGFILYTLFLRIRKK
jgi:hypothetical protein